MGVEPPQPSPVALRLLCCSLRWAGLHGAVRVSVQAKTKGFHTTIDIGVKYAEKQTRRFDEGKLKAGQSVIGLQVRRQCCPIRSQRAVSVLSKGDGPRCGCGGWVAVYTACPFKAHGVMATFRRDLGSQLTPQVFP